MKFLTKELTKKFNVNPPASIDAIRQFEAESGVLLQEDYAAFLMQSNGGDGFIGRSYASLWRVEELIERNRGYQVSEFAPGLLLFGSDGGGEAFAFDRRSDEQPVVRVPFTPLELKEVLAVATSFEGFIDALFNS